jgi:hypothetical protein
VVHLWVFVLANGAATHAAVLCQKKSGAVFVRAACKRKEKALDPVALGLVGPRGDAGPQGPPGIGPLGTCPADAVLAGTTCMDKYEASVWLVPAPTTVNATLVTDIQQGRATAVALVAGGATQLGIGATNDYAPCAVSGQNCANIFAVSLPGVPPSANITWFQAQAACKNARKRLPSNAEWQAAVAGTPDPGPDNGSTDCHTVGGAAVNTGSRSACVSSDGAFDMVGNLFEWVADWVPRSVSCGTWSAGVSPTGDEQCLLDVPMIGEPAALARGGSSFSGVAAGPLAVEGRDEPSGLSPAFGFRCAR